MDDLRTLDVLMYDINVRGSLEVNSENFSDTFLPIVNHFFSAISDAIIYKDMSNAISSRRCFCLLLDDDHF